MRGETELNEPLVRMEDPDSSSIPALEGRRLWSRPEKFSINPEMQQHESLNYERSINRHFLGVLCSVHRMEFGLRRDGCFCCIVVGARMLWLWYS